MPAARSSDTVLDTASTLTAEMVARQARQFVSLISGPTVLVAARNNILAARHRGSQDTYVRGRDN
jgi:hypothetical protein